MRALTQTNVMVRALCAALLTTLACYPRVERWSHRTNSMGYLSVLMVWSAFVLWAFVLAWHAKYTGRQPLVPPKNSRLWAAATAYGLGMGLIFHFLLDPQMRLTTPQDYPATLRAWVEMMLFSLSLEPLFLCFAPFAFCLRLLRQEQRALLGTVIFAVFVFYLKLSSSKTIPPWPFLGELVVVRVVAGFIGTFLYCRGGAWMVWWPVLIAQSRHLIDLHPAN